MATATLESRALTAEQIEAELSESTPVASEDTQPHATSFEKLTDRTFELLVYELFKAGGSLADELRPNRVQILPVGADRGRDIVLLADQKPIGVVQCKKHAKPLTRPDALRELARFILAALVDSTLLTPNSALTYVLAVSKGLTEPAQILFNETARIVKKEDALVRACALEVRNQYEGLRDLDPTKAVEHVVATLEKAKLRYLAAEDLDSWLKERPLVYPKFFSARIVVDSALVEKGLAEIKRDMSWGSTIENERVTESWYHPSQAAAYSVVARAPAGSGAGPILLKDVYVARHLQVEVDEWLTKGAKGPMGALVVVVAPGGFGKSSLLWQCHRMRNAQPNEHALLFSASLIEAKVDRNEFERGLAALVQHAKDLIADGRSVVVCLDTFDVLAHRDDLREAGLRLARQLVAAGASVLMSSRPEEVAAIPIEEIADVSVRLHLREFDDDEFDDAVASYCRAFYRDSALTSVKVEEQITRMRELVGLGRPVKQVCLNPLTFRMLFELYAPNEVPEDINSFQLYSEYWRRRVRTDRRTGLGPASGRDLSSAVQWVASRMLAQGTPSLSSKQISNGIIEDKLEDADESELLSRHLLQRSSSDRLEFFHQTFFEHAAARHLYVLGDMSLDRCVAKMREAADDAFRFPVYEQLFLLYAAREEQSIELDRHVGDLLSAEHPALSGAGLHAHMLAEQGYSAGRRVIEDAVRRQNFHILKRFSQRIHHLHSMRVREVVDLIAVVCQNCSWSQMEALSQLFSWLAQSDWAVCRRELERTDFVGVLSQFAHGSTLDPEHLAILVFRRGLLPDPVWSISQLFRFERHSHAARAVLEFVGAEAAKLSLAAAQTAQRLVLERFSVSPGKVDGTALGYSASCLAAIWRIHASLAQIDPATISLDSSPRSSLLLRAVAISPTPTLTALKRSLIRRVANEREMLPFYVLMHQFMTPLLMADGEIDATVWQDAMAACEALLDEALSVESNRSAIASREFSSLYARKRTVALPWTRVVVQPPGHWLRPSSNPRLLAIALAEGSPGALEALEQMCSDLQVHAARLATLRGALSEFPVSANCFSCILRISETLSDVSPLLAMLEQAEAGGEREFLASTIASHELRISALARLAQQSKKESSRSAGMRLLAFLIRHGATTRPSYVEVSSWVKGEAKRGARAAALSLLVQVTVPTTGAETVSDILRSVDPKNTSSHNSAVEHLHEVMAMPGVNLPKDLCNLVLDFCLAETASEPQVSLAGRLIDLYLDIGDVPTANAIGLTLLRSPTAQLLSATQKKTLGHHLDKPFVALYRRSTVDDLGMHLVELRQVDEHLGRLIAVSLCKSERNDLSKFLTAVIGDVDIPTSLRRVVQDYRQHLLRL